jgi:hypothetical protein
VCFSHSGAGFFRSSHPKKYALLIGWVQCACVCVRVEGRMGWGWTVLKNFSSPQTMWNAVKICWNVQIRVFKDSLSGHFCLSGHRYNFSRPQTMWNAVKTCRNIQIRVFKDSLSGHFCLSGHRYNFSRPQTLWNAVKTLECIDTGI